MDYTLKDLSMYGKLKREIDEVEHRIAVLERRRAAGEDGAVWDSVQGSFPDLPYAKHTIVIRGRSRIESEYELRRAHLIAIRASAKYELQRLQQFIEGLPVSQVVVRRAIGLHYVDGRSWSDVARVMHMAPDAPRTAVWRYFKSKGGEADGQDQS